VYLIDVSEDYPRHFLEQAEPYLNKITDKKISKKNKLKNSRVNLKIIEEFTLKWQKFVQRQEDFKAAKNEFMGISHSLESERRKREKTFLSGFRKISQYFKLCYRVLAKGGDASLDLIDSTSPFEEGVLISVRPPDKSWKKISKLSGGEKTLTSLSLVYALHFFKPNSFYFMDEIDAALDYKNVGIVSKFIKQRAKNAQFIVISLVNNMYEQADQLVGIYKVKGVTNHVMFNPAKFEELLKKISAMKNQSQNHK
jgi:structural maintenance of chromosome 4